MIHFNADRKDFDISVNRLYKWALIEVEVWC
jgi:hypothetical protein